MVVCDCGGFMFPCFFVPPLNTCFVVVHFIGALCRSEMRAFCRLALPLLAVAALAEQKSVLDEMVAFPWRSSVFVPELSHLQPYKHAFPLLQRE